jgi:hypothetical protein
VIVACICVLGVGCALTKAAAPIVLGEHALPKAAQRFFEQLAPALLAGLVIATALSRPH